MERTFPAARHIGRRKILAVGVAGMTLSGLPGAVAQAVGSSRSVAADRPTYVYVTSFENRSASPDGSPDANAIYVFQFDPGTGTLTPVQQVPGSGPAWMEIDPSKRFLYACSSLNGTETARVGEVDVYAIDPRDGTLTFLNRVSPGDRGPAQLTVAPDGRHVVVANYYYGEYVVLPVGQDGRLGAVSGSLKNTGSGPHPRQAASHPHAVTFDPKGRFLGTADLGIDKVQIFRLAGGGLERVSEASVTSGMGPRHLAFSRDGRTLYVIGELDGNITAFAYDSTTGAIGRPSQTVSTEPSDYAGAHSGAEIALHPSGRFLYGSNRGSQNIAGYRIDTSTGQLSLIGFATQGVNGPTNFAIDPTGRWLYVNSTGGNEVVQFAIVPRTGALEPTGNTTPLPAPGVMVFHPRSVGPPLPVLRLHSRLRSRAGRNPQHRAAQTRVLMLTRGSVGSRTVTQLQLAGMEVLLALAPFVCRGFAVSLCRPCRSPLVEEGPVGANKSFLVGVAQQVPSGVKPCGRRGGGLPAPLVVGDQVLGGEPFDWSRTT